MSGLSFPAWIETDDGKCYWITDEQIEQHGLKFTVAKRFKLIRKIWKIKGGKEEESPYPSIPPGLAKDIMAGKCQKMMLKSGYKLLKFNKKGELHSLTTPALIKTDSTEEWFFKGKLHRLGGPASIYGKGKRRDYFWYINDIPYNPFGPAVKEADGTRYWHNARGELDRVGAPAVISGDGCTREWYRHDERHRDDGGPAIEYDDGEYWYKIWYWHDVYIKTKRGYHSKKKKRGKKYE